nr:PadR family transcriptional regulator [Tessaracoccus coleopterorum]
MPLRLAQPSTGRPGRVAPGPGSLPAHRARGHPSHPSRTTHRDISLTYLDSTRILVVSAPQRRRATHEEIPDGTPGFRTATPSRHAQLRLRRDGWRWPPSRSTRRPRFRPHGSGLPGWPDGTRLPRVSGRPQGGGRRARRGDVRLAALLLIAEEPRNGYQIIQELESRTEGRWRPSPGAIYPALSQLEDEGLIRPVDAATGKAFEITDAGSAEAERLAQQPAPGTCRRVRSGAPHTPSCTASASSARRSGRLPRPAMRRPSPRRLRNSRRSGAGSTSCWPSRDQQRLAREIASGSRLPRGKPEGRAEDLRTPSSVRMNLSLSSRHASSSTSGRSARTATALAR